jgi:hypothetical protein
MWGFPDTLSRGAGNSPTSKISNLAKYSKLCAKEPNFRSKIRIYQVGTVKTCPLKPSNGSPRGVSVSLGWVVTSSLPNEP